MPKQEYKIIDDIQYNHDWTFRYPELDKQVEGLLVVLEPEQINTVDELSGKTALVKKPNGEVAEFTIHHSEVHHGVVGIFFASMEREEIPRGSMICWE